MPCNLSVVILTLNEETHIARALQNVQGWAKDVIVLDSGSIDATCDIARGLGVRVVHRDFDTYANQRNFAIREIEMSTEWMLFLDADEYLLDPLKAEISRTLMAPKVDGYYLKRRVYFMGKWVRRGGYYPSWILRLFRRSKAACIRDMNEHIQVEGATAHLTQDFVDHNLRGVGDWTTKHNRYAHFEALEILGFQQRRQRGEKNPMAKLWGTGPEIKQWIREYIWYPILPPLVRPFVMWVYRYVFRLGFLDGRAGLIFHFLQGCWYPFLIDVKYLEMLNKNEDLL